MPRSSKAVPPTLPVDDPPKKTPAIQQLRRGDAKDEWGGFVQANLTPMDKALFDQWYSEHIQHIQAYVDEALDSGLKLTIVFDGANNCYITSYTGRPNNDPALPFRCTLSARAGEYAAAVALLVYKHHVICNGDWSEYLINGSKVTNWG